MVAIVVRVTPLNRHLLHSPTLLTMLAKSLLSAAISAPLAQAALLWDGRFNDLTSAADLNLWSWADQVGPYQYYIHGNGTVDQYVALSPNYTNPADSVSRQGAKITLDGTAYWNGQDMRRTELIPRPDEIIDSNLTFWHFSIRKTALNEPVLERLHKYAFFEAGFSELNSGYTGDDEDLSNDGNTCNSTTLRWMREHQTAWWVEWEVDTWYNFAYEVVRSRPS